MSGNRMTGELVRLQGFQLRSPGMELLLLQLWMVSALFAWNMARICCYTQYWGPSWLSAISVQSVTAQIPGWVVAPPPARPSLPGAGGEASLLQHTLTNPDKFLV